MIDQRLQQQSADQNLITLALEKENQLLCSKVDDLEIKYDTWQLNHLRSRGNDASEESGGTSTLTPTQAILKLFNERLDVPVKDQDLVKGRSKSIRKSSH